jgi:hypothetical protein
MVVTYYGSCTPYLNATSYSNYVANFCSCGFSFFVHLRSFIGKQGHKARQLSRENEIVPCTIMQVETVQKRSTDRIRRVLVDLGSTHSFLKRSALLVGTRPCLPPSKQRVMTIGGETMCTSHVTLCGLILPKFLRSLQVKEHHEWVHDNENVSDVGI